MKGKNKADVACTAEKTNGSETKKSRNILPLFWDLASLEEDKRVQRAVDLISTLKTEEDSEEDVEYTLKRLITGLSSSRKGARQGYATALTQLLTNFQNINVEKVYDLMKENLATKGSFRSQEERDAFFGQAFCHAAIYQAVFQRDEDKEKNMPFVSKTLEGLLGLMKKKSFLQELCSTLITDIIEKVNKECFERDILPLLDEMLKKGWKSCTPEDLMILLAVERVHKDSLGKLFFKTHWEHSSVCDKDNFDKLANVLMSSTITAHPRMHIVWKDVIPCVIKSTKALSSFWALAIEESLMQSTHERKFLAFNVLREVLSAVTKSQVEVIFSSRLVKSIFNGCTSDKNYLHTAIRNMLTSIPPQVAKNSNPGVALAVIHQLVGRYGNFQFDVMTRTKTVESLIGQLDSESVVELATWLQNLYIAGKDTESGSTSESDEDKVSLNRKWAITQLLVITKNPNAKKNEQLLQEIAKFLFFHGYFHVVKRKKNQPLLFTIVDPAFEDSVVSMCKERFLGVLGELSSIHHAHQGEQVKPSSNSIIGTTNDGDFYAYNVVHFAKELLGDAKHVTLNQAWTPEASETFGNVLQVIEDIRTKVARDAAMSENRAFELLFLHTCVQMFDKTEEAAEVAEELLECYKKVNEKKKKLQDSQEPHWSEVLTEILLSFLAQSSHLMRQIVNLVFSMMLPHVTSAAFQLIVEALKPKKNAADGGLELVNESDEEMGFDEEDSDEDEASDDDNEDDESSGDSEGESGKDGEIDEAFKTEIKSALGDAAHPDESTDESDDGEASDIDMDAVDPKLLRTMDQALAAAFKARLQSKSGKRKKLEGKKAIIHFRLRVLDVAETFVKKQAKSPLILDLIEPLLEVIKVSAIQKEEKALHDRALGIFKNKICHPKELPSGLEIDQENVHSQIERLVTLAKDASSIEMVNLITQACMLLIRVLRGKEDIKEPSPLKTRGQRKRKNPKSEIDTNGSASSHNGVLDITRIVRIFTDALKDFMLKRNSRLQPVLFLELIKRYPVVAWNMSTEFPVYLSKAVNNFRKGQACEMILQLLARQAAGSEKDFGQLIAPLQEELILAFKETCNETCSLKAKNVHELVKLVDRLIKKGEECKEASSDLDAKRLADALEESIEGPIISRSPKLVAYCKSIVSALKESSQKEKVGKKRQKKDPTSESGKLLEIDNQPGNTETETVRIAKVKKNKKKHKD